MDNMKRRRLQELDRSDFGIVEGEPDIRGWDVRDNAGKKIGEVEELILDAQQGKVRYMVVELDDDDLDLEDDKKVLIPIGLAELDREDDDVLLPSITVEQLQALPSYDADNLDDEAERRICSVLGRQEVTGTRMDREEGSTDYRERGATRERETTTGDNNNISRQEKSDQPALGTPEYYASFYQHAYFNDENLSRNRSQNKGRQQGEAESDYERGLRLWEMRSEGGTIAGDTGGMANREQDMTEERRMEIRRGRRQSYEDRRGHGKGKTIIDRIKDEGLRDAGLNSSQL